MRGGAPVWATTDRRVALSGPIGLAAQDRAPLVAGRPEADWCDDLRNPRPVVSLNI